MKNSLPVKVGILIVLAFGLVSAAGYLTYTSLSSIVSSIQVKSSPDMRLILIRDLTAGLEKAENSVRLYRLTQNKEDIKPYYEVIDGIDEKIDSLRSASVRDTQLLARIDTISLLIEDNMIVWNNMIDLYHTDSLDIYIRTLAAKIAVGTLNRNKPEKNILRRVLAAKPSGMKPAYWKINISRN
jgi:CHASE3 domain sensor protein